MARVTLNEVRAWTERTKLNLTELDTELLAHLEEEALVQISPRYDISAWTDPSNTPKIIRVIISKMYASFYIDRAYSENQDENNDYALKLMDNASMLLKGLISGDFEIPSVQPSTPSTASFYPTDVSSAQEPTIDNPSLGGPYFSLGKVF